MEGSGQTKLTIGSGKPPIEGGVAVVYELLYLCVHHVCGWGGFGEDGCCAGRHVCAQSCVVFATCGCVVVATGMCARV